MKMHLWCIQCKYVHKVIHAVNITAYSMALSEVSSALSHPVAPEQNSGGPFQTTHSRPGRGGGAQS